MSNPNHRSPVGVTQSLDLITSTGLKLTTACFLASDVPVGTELFVQPKDSRLSLEVEVANENAAHHQAECRKRGDQLHRYRSLLRATHLLLTDRHLDSVNAETAEHVKNLAILIEKELG